MAFLSLKTVPTISGCVIDSPPPVGQIVFPSLEALMFYGWKAATFNITVSGTISLTNEFGVFVSVDSGGGPTTATGQGGAPRPPTNMSNFVCNARASATHDGTFFVTTNGGTPAIDLLSMGASYQTAHRNGSQFWFDGWFFFASGLTIDPIGPDVGALLFDGIEVSRLYYSGLFDSLGTYALLEPYVINVTTVEENAPN